MSGTRPNPTAGRRVLAARLRRMRLAAGKSTEDAARELMVSPSKISRLEGGERAPQARDVRDLGRYYEAPEEEIEELQALVSEARRKGWWAHYSLDNDEQVDLYLGLETAASSLKSFENLRWPGLLQTEEVSRVMVEGLRLAGELSREFIKDQVLIRRERQRRVLDGELRLHAIMDEAMFRRPLGEGLVEQQAKRVREWSRSLSNVVIQIVPLSRGAYPGLDGTFNLLQYPDNSGLDEVAFVEGLRGNMLIERPSLVERYRSIFQNISDQYALDPRSSAVWLDGFLEEMGKGDLSEGKPSH